MPGAQPCRGKGGIESYFGAKETTSEKEGTMTDRDQQDTLEETRETETRSSGAKADAAVKTKPRKRKSAKKRSEPRAAPAAEEPVETESRSGSGDAAAAVAIAEAEIVETAALDTGTPAPGQAAAAGGDAGGTPGAGPARAAASAEPVQAVASANQEPEPMRAAAPQPEAAAIMGQVTWLMMHSPMHRHLFVTDFEWLLLPPLMQRQFRIFRRNNVPFAFASWAWMTEEVEKRFLSGVRRLRPADWKGGDRLWLVDLIAPFGGLDAVAKELRENVFADHEVRLLRVAEDGKGVRMETWRGANLAEPESAA